VDKPRSMLAAANGMVRLVLYKMEAAIVITCASSLEIAAVTCLMHHPVTLVSEQLVTNSLIRLRTIFSLS